jgi:hypothetical protein
VTALAAEYRVVLITKGDLLDQERKLAQSGLGDLFDGVEIVSHKTADSLSPDLCPPRHRGRSGDDGRQFAEIRRDPGARGRVLGRACATWPDLGTGSRRSAQDHRRFHA